MVRRIPPGSSAKPDVIFEGFASIDGGFGVDAVAAGSL
jgi:hypothetical protein